MTIRQQIVNSIKAKLQTISIAGGFATNAGTSVSIWRSVPFAVSELPGIILRDLDEPIDEHTQSSARHVRHLHIQIEVLAAGDGADDVYRNLLGDVEKAIKSGKLADGTWWANADGHGLAYRTRPRISRMIAAQESSKVAGGIYECFVDYITRDFDSYE